MEGNKNVSFEIKTLSNLIRQEVFAAMHGSCGGKEHGGATGLHGMVIGFLAENEGRDIFQRDIEAEFHIRRSTASGILRLMEENGHITRTPVPYDARLKKIVLTDKARALHSRVTETLRGVEKQLTRGIPPKERAAFMATAEKMRRNLAADD